MALLVKPTPDQMLDDPRLTEFLQAQGLTSAAVLTEEISVAWAYVEHYTCLDLDALDDASSEGILAKRAFYLRFIQQAIRDDADFASRENDNLIRSFSVPGYSETRFGPNESGSSSSKTLKVNEWSQLNSLLLSLMTDPCYDKWLDRYNDEPNPASAILEVDWFGIPSNTNG